LFYNDTPLESNETRHAINSLRLCMH